KDQEAHDGNGDGDSDHWLDGNSMFWGADCVYKYNAPQPHGKGDWTVQGEYFNRRKDLDMIANDLNPTLVGNHLIDDQDGYYLQAVYGFIERWRGGLRFEQVGLINTTKLPDGSQEDFGSSYRAGVMIDFTPSEFSRLRVQVNHGSYETADGREPVTEFFLQWMISLGAHGAHKF
ncbi:MAG: zinc-regulated TonB-dependent outer membrane receptor, partial [Kiritimatiellae bacterium]|nr:zinc-regulated TonB-dependent outer membrane receptor [Kiritimatiellia bacterium]